MSERLTRFFASRWCVILAGAVIGVQFLRSGYNLRCSRAAHGAVGWILPVMMIGLLLLLVFAPKVGENVRRAAEKMGCTVEVERVGEELKLIFSK